VYGFDVWLTPDEVAGIGERRAFQQAHLKALGLDADNPAAQGAMQQFLAQYAGTLKDLAGKAGSLQGHPLRTHFHVSMGGEHCGQAKQLSARSPGSGNAASGTDDIAAAAREDASRKVPDLGSSTANAVAGKLLGSLFSKKTATTSTSGANAAGPGAGDAAAPYLTVLSLSIETTAVDTAAIAPSQFEIPAGWLPEKPKAESNREFSCPVADPKTSS
jgi:hypothetical protein